MKKIIVILASVFFTATAWAQEISSFDISPNEDLSPGTQLDISVEGTPRSKVTVRIDGIPRTIILKEVNSGSYEGEYTIRSKDKLPAHPQAKASLAKSGKVTRMTLEEPLDRVASSTSSTLRRTERQAATVDTCQKTCGKVVEIREVAGEASNNVLGTIAGSVVGGLLGNQVGSGRGNTAATIAGAAGGAYAGNQAQKKYGNASHYEVSVKMNDGDSQVFSFKDNPEFRRGDRVEVVDGRLQRRG